MNEPRESPRRGPTTLDRRSFLKSSGAAAGAAWLGANMSLPGATPAAAAPERKAKRVIVVAFAGGVRTKETLGTPGNVPALKALADEGVFYPRTRTSNLGHFGATLSLFTGVSEARGIRENARGDVPTLFEYLRKDLALPANEVWISSSGGAQQTNYSYSLHADYGQRVGANTLDGDGVFNEEFKSILDAYGRPREMEPAEAAVLERMRGSMGKGVDRAQGGQDALNSTESAAMLERYILEELGSGTSEMRGVAAADAKALRVARNLFGLFRPTALGIVLNRADVAHGSFNSYVEVIRQNDAMLGELVGAVKADPELASSTAIFVLPEFGRDRDLNSRRGLDHGDGSDDLNFVGLVCWGPDFRRGGVVNEEVRTIDVCPTVCGLLGAKARYSKGKELPGLYG